MGYFPTLEEAKKVKRIHLTSDPNYWVEVPVKLRWEQGKHFLDRNESGRISADIALVTLIQNWNLTDANGDIAPITQEYIDLMDPGDAYDIIDKSGQIVAESQDEAAKRKKNSPKNSSGTSKTKQTKAKKTATK